MSGVGMKYTQKRIKAIAFQRCMLPFNVISWRTTAAHSSGSGAINYRLVLKMITRENNWRKRKHIHTPNKSYIDKQMGQLLILQTENYENYKWKRTKKTQ